MTFSLKLPVILPLLTKIPVRGHTRKKVTHGYDSEVIRAFATLFTWSGFSESEEDSTWITEIVTVKTLNNTNTNFQYLVNISTRDII